MISSGSPRAFKCHVTQRFIGYVCAINERNEFLNYLKYAFGKISDLTLVSLMKMKYFDITLLRIKYLFAYKACVLAYKVCVKISFASS